jgi:hypothetical protein
MKKVMLFCYLLLFAAVVFCQTKTEEAKKRLDNDRPRQKTENNEKEKTSDGEEEKDDDGDDFFWSCLGTGVLNIFKVSTHLLFNIPYSFDEEAPLEAQPVFYNKYPYQDNRNNCFRTYNQGDSLRFQIHFAIGDNFKDHFYTWNVNGIIHFYGWALRSGYKTIDEQGAPSAIKYFSIKIERKSLAFNFMDMGFSAGYGNINISDNNYGGIEFGYNLELFLIRPLSLVINPNIMFYKSHSIKTITAAMNYHYQSYYLGIGYDPLNIAGINFNNFQMRIGKYF